MSFTAERMTKPKNRRIVSRPTPQRRRLTANVRLAPASHRLGSTDRRQLELDAGLPHAKRRGRRETVVSDDEIEAFERRHLV
jgi:hypothetical protein